jgi:hypothetical protein
MVKAVAGKGDMAEEALAEYFRLAGFFAVRGIPFRHEGADLTDLDVWLYERGAGMSRRRFIVDSKNKKTPKVAERIFWTSGLRDALELDGAYVASTSPREETRKLARRVNVTLIDITALTRPVGSDGPSSTARLAKEEIDRALAQIDKEHEGKLWRTHRDDLVASVIMGFGGGTANVALRSIKFFIEQAQSTVDGSSMHEVARRMFYFALSFAAISLDYVAAKNAFQPTEQRKSDIEDVLRFGTDPQETKRRLALSLQLLRNYLHNGGGIANQLRSRIDDETKAMPVDIVADVVVKMAGKGQLFEAARVLERAAHERNVPGLTELSVDARSFAGAVFDYLGFDRMVMGRVFGEGTANASNAEATAASEQKTLFDNTEN